MLPKYAAFSDESHHNDGRFRGIAAISLPAAVVVHVSSEIRGVLADSGLTEFKWQNLSSARERFAAIKLIDHFCRTLVPDVSPD